MSQEFEYPTVPVTFIRDGFYWNGQVHLARTWTVLPSSFASLSSEEQVAQTACPSTSRASPRTRATVRQARGLAIWLPPEADEGTPP